MASLGASLQGWPRGSRLELELFRRSTEVDPSEAVLGIACRASCQQSWAIWSQLWAAFGYNDCYSFHANVGSSTPNANMFILIICEVEPIRMHSSAFSFLVPSRVERFNAIGRSQQTGILLPKPLTICQNGLRQRPPEKASDCEELLRVTELL